MRREIEDKERDKIEKEIKALAGRLEVEEWKVMEEGDGGAGVEN